MLVPLSTLFGLVSIILAVLILPFLIKRIEHNLEVFLLMMGTLSVSISGNWSLGLVEEALYEPIKITLAVLVMGLIFYRLRAPIHDRISGIERSLGLPAFAFLVVTLLGLLSSAITAIIASLVLVEIISGLKLDRRLETNLVILACFSIGMGAALTPIGEPLSTIATAKLKGEPYHAGFLFLAKILAIYILPGIIALGLASVLLCKEKSEALGWRLFSTLFRAKALESLSEREPETLRSVLLRAAKVYIFVTALVLLGTGFKPIIDNYIIKLPAQGLYWINMISAILDNATLTAAEVSSAMSLGQIQSILLALLISGGMLIPGNIPNIIAAGKLGISMRQWARIGLPLGLILMLIYFVALLLLG